MSIRRALFLQLLSISFMALWLIGCDKESNPTTLSCGCEYSKGPTVNHFAYIHKITADSSAIEIHKSSKHFYEYEQVGEDSLCNFNLLFPYENSAIRYSTRTALTCAEDSLNSQTIVHLEDFSHEFVSREEISDDHYKIFNAMIAWDTLNFNKHRLDHYRPYQNVDYKFITQTLDWNLSNYFHRLWNIEDELRMGEFIGPFLSLPIDSTLIIREQNSTFSINPESGYNCRFSVPIIRKNQAIVWADYGFADAGGRLYVGDVYKYALVKMDAGEWKITERCHLFIYG